MMKTITIKTSLLLLSSFLSHLSFSQDRDFYDNLSLYLDDNETTPMYVEGHLGGIFMNSDVKRLNNSLPSVARKIPEKRYGVVMGINAGVKGWQAESDLAISRRSRIFLNDYEQIYVSQMTWSLSAGPNIAIGKKKNVHLGLLGGVAYSSLRLKYLNDSIGKPSGIPWVYNQPFQPGSGNDEDIEEGIVYNSPAFNFIGQVRISWIIRNRFTVTGFGGYMADVSDGKWHYDKNYVRKSSPNTSLSGMFGGLKMGVMIH